MAAVLPGYASVARAAEALHLAPRSVRDLIYAGRLPSLRIGRLHYVRASDLDLERRRRLGLPLPQPQRARRRQPRPALARQPRPAAAPQPAATQHEPADTQHEPAVAQQGSAADMQQEPAASTEKENTPQHPERPRVDPELRRRRAVERVEVVRRWAQRHEPTTPRVPFAPVTLSEATTCAACGRALRANQRALDALEPGQRLCLTCGRRALMVWADQRRLEAAAARRMALDLGVAPPSDQSPRAAA